MGKDSKQCVSDIEVVDSFKRLPFAIFSRLDFACKPDSFTRYAAVLDSCSHNLKG